MNIKQLDSEPTINNSEPNNSDDIPDHIKNFTRPGENKFNIKLS